MGQVLCKYKGSLVDLLPIMYNTFFFFFFIHTTNKEIKRFRLTAELLACLITNINTNYESQCPRIYTEIDKLL